MASHHACSGSQLYSYISNAVGALIDCRKVSPSPCRRSYTLRWQTRGMEDPASKESSTAAAASGPASNAKTVLVEHPSSPMPLTRPERWPVDPARCDVQAAVCTVQRAYAREADMVIRDAGQLRRAQLRIISTRNAALGRRADRSEEAFLGTAGVSGG